MLGDLPSAFLPLIGCCFEFRTDHGPSHGCRMLKNQKDSRPSGWSNYRSSISTLYIAEDAAMEMQMHCHECLAVNVDALMEVQMRSPVTWSA